MLTFRRVPRLRALWILAAMCSGLGCASTPAMRDGSVQIVPRRLVAVPSDGVVFEFDIHEKRTLHEDQSAQARKNLDASITRRLSVYGGRFVDDNTMGTLKYAAKFHVWTLDMFGDIMAERLGRTYTKHKSVSDWRFSPGLESWRSALGADFVLVSLFIHGRDTTGRAVAVAFVGGSKAARRAISCVVQLKDGRVVWCNFIDSHLWNLTVPAGAQALADSLLGDMLIAK
jgi:hypothetical protein